MKPAPVDVSPNVKALSIDPKSVPSLTLLGGAKMPISGLGMCCRPGASGDAARQAVLDYLVMGGRHIDTAELYSNHEQVGQGIREAIERGVQRSDIFLTTKLVPDNFGFEATLSRVPEMLQELGLDYVDLLLLHWAGAPEGADCGTPKACRQETWMALQRLQAKGLVKNLGVSNFGPRQMEELLALKGAPVAVNQLEYHPFVPYLHLDTVEWCHQRGIAVTAYGSMGSNKMSAQMTAQDALKQIGEKHGKTSGQVLLRWAVQNNVSVIPGTSNPKHMAENLRTFDFKLSDEQVGALDGVPESGRMLHFGHWPDQRP